MLGVDNDPVLCELCDPPLSSVIPDARRTGYVAAELLDQWMAGTPVPAVAHRIAPLGVHTRQSTDVLAIDDKDIAATVRLIREHACEGIQVADLLARCTSHAECWKAGSCATWAALPMPRS